MPSRRNHGHEPEVPPRSRRPGLRLVGFWLAWPCAAGCGSDGGDAGAPTCGDGFAQAGEVCDDGLANSDTMPGACRTTCVSAFCGDGVVDPKEACDEGMDNSDTQADACRVTCKRASCGDAVVDTGEGCDDGDANSDTQADVCRASCAPASCGDRVVDMGEQCDDGNDTDGDSCGNDCDSRVVWTRTIQGPIGLGIAVDASDHILLVGSVYGVGGTLDVWMAKFDPDGESVWETTYAGDGDDEGLGAMVDSEGNLLAVGYETSALGDLDVWVGKVDPTGVLVWTRTYGGVAGGDDRGLQIVADQDANVIVVGYETAAAGDDDVWIRKYDGLGNPLWTRTYGGTAGGNDYGLAVAALSDDSVVVAAGEDWDGSSLAWLRRYDLDGAEQWTQTWAGPEGYAVATGVAVDGDDDVLATGFSYSTVGGWDTWVRKYDADGGALWTRTYDGPAHDNDWPWDAATDASGNMLVTGQTTSDVDSGLDVWTAKYLPDGTLAWSRTYNGIGDEDDTGWGVAADSAGNVLVVGSEGDPMSDLDFLWLTKYPP